MAFGNLFGGDKTTVPGVDNSLPSYEPDWMKMLGSLLIPQAPPGQLQMLSRNLADGGFGTPKTNMSYLDKVYDPVQVPDFFQGVKQPTTRPNTGPAKPKTDPGGMYVNKPGGGMEFKEWGKLETGARKKMGY
jgi:hypothetical protein